MTTLSPALRGVRIVAEITAMPEATASPASHKAGDYAAVGH
jgi:hypothetical protein